MSDTTTKTAEALASALEKRAALHADGCSLGALHDAELSDLLTKAAVAIRAAQPQAEPAEDDVRELRKWLNEEPNRPIDRAALARVLAAQPQAEPVAADGLVLVPVEPTPEMEAAGSDAGDGHDWVGPRAVYGAMLAARPPVAQQGAEEAEDNERFDKAVDDARQWLQHEQAVYLSVPSTRKLVLRIMDALASPQPAAAQPVAQGLTDLGPYFCGYARISNGEYKLAGMRSTEVMKDSELHPIYAFPHELIEALHALSTTHPAQADEGDKE
jgi:hypothetical protein